MPMAEPMSKQTLLDKMQTRRAEWDGLIAQVGEDRLEQPGVVGEWSAKDLAAHILFWEKEMSIALDEMAQGQTPRFATMNDTDALNEQNWQRSHGRPAQEVLAESQAVFRRLVEQVRATPEEELLDPDRYAWLEGKPLWRAVASETYGHYRMHVDQLRAWVENK